MSLIGSKIQTPRNYYQSDCKHHGSAHHDFTWTYRIKYLSEYGCGNAFEPNIGISSRLAIWSLKPIERITSEGMKITAEYTRPYVSVSIHAMAISLFFKRGSATMESLAFFSILTNIGIKTMKSIGMEPL